MQLSVLIMWSHDHGLYFTPLSHCFQHSVSASGGVARTPGQIGLQYDA